MPMMLPSGVTRLAGSDTIEPAALRGTVSVLQVSGPSDRRPHQVQNLASTTIRLLIRRPKAFCWVDSGFRVDWEVYSAQNSPRSPNPPVL